MGAVAAASSASAPADARSTEASRRLLPFANGPPALS